MFSMTKSRELDEVQTPLNFVNRRHYERRARGDMIKVFKWVKGINKGNIDHKHLLYLIRIYFMRNVYF